MKIVLLILITVVLNSCDSAFRKNREVIAYSQFDFQNSYKKYLVKEGFVKYEVVKSVNEKLDTSMLEIFFDNYGSEELIKESNNNLFREFYKKDSIQYEKDKNNWFSFRSTRRLDFHVERLVFNKTSRHYESLMCGKPTDSNFNKERGFSCLYGISRYGSGDVELFNRASISYYKGIPVGYKEHIIGEPSNEISIQLIELDTSTIFPVGIKVSKSIRKNKSVPNDTCRCDWNLEKINQHTDLTFSNNGKPFNLDSLSKWINNSEAFKIKSLRLIDFDTIPPEMSIFKNVESVYLEAINFKNVQGLDVFPKLKILKAEEERFKINENAKWMKRIEVIHINKTSFSGLISFDQMPNLREIRMSFSGFDTFPSDFENLKCLTYFQTGAHTFGEIDLTKLDFTNMPCLRHVEFQSWKKNILGIPNGLKKVETVKISHPNLTDSEKEKVKD